MNLQKKMPVKQNINFVWPKWKYPIWHLIFKHIPSQRDLYLVHILAQLMLTTLVSATQNTCRLYSNICTCDSIG